LETGSAHIFKQEAPNLLDPLDPAVRRYHWNTQLV